ncbi:MAG TPA: hypothetical protein VGB37_11260 [Candidatus Lokiarchaeia archaeon]
MDFTIEVRKKEKDEEFEFKELEILHQECYGGKIVVKDFKERIDEESKHPLLVCSRCKKEIDIWDYDMIKIIRTAVDGEKREIKRQLPSDSITVIQKT